MAFIIVLLIILLKFLLPVLHLFFPFSAGWINFVLDSIDGDILLRNGLADGAYQNIDKVADWCTYIFMAGYAYKKKWPIRKIILGLFLYRSIGQVFFLITHKEYFLFIFANFLEPLFLVTATILAYQRVVKHAKKWSEAGFNIIHRHSWSLGISIFLYKLQDEYITHIGNFDRTDFFQNLFR